MKKMMKEAKVRKKVNLDALDEHITRLEATEKMLEGLNMDLEPIQRYLGGLRMARDLVTGTVKKRALLPADPLQDSMQLCDAPAAG